MTNTPSSDSAGIRQAIRALRADGWRLDYVNDGGDRVPVATEQETIDAIMAVDDASLFVIRDHGPFADSPETGHVYFVMGNAPEEVVCDYTTNLTALDRLLESWD